MEQKNLTDTCQQIYDDSEETDEVQKESVINHRKNGTEATKAGDACPVLAVDMVM